jgi:hypothetical protein
VAALLELAGRCSHCSRRTLWTWAARTTPFIAFLGLLFENRRLSLL